jgi:hypothetical protein
VVYLSQHWVIDAIAGAVWATAIFFLVEWFWMRRAVGRQSSAVSQDPTAGA